MSAPGRPPSPQPAVVWQGRFLRCIQQGSWEYVERCNCRGAVMIVAVTDGGKLLLTEQFRIPVGRLVIELPAGLVGDEGSAREETIETAAMRELLEETGYEAARVELLIAGPTSAGLSAEVVTVVRATGLTKRCAGGGEAGEAITVHEVPLPEIERWLQTMERRGVLIDTKIYAGLYLLQQTKT